MGDMLESSIEEQEWRADIERRYRREEEERRREEGERCSSGIS